jgi:hypothetical protein
MPSSDVLARRIAVALLVIEEDIGAKRFQEGPFLQPPQKQRFVDADIPRPQGTHDAFVCRRATSSHQCRADQRRVFLLNALQGRKEGDERAAGHWRPGGRCFVADKCVESLGLENRFRFVGENDRIAIERDADLIPCTFSCR